MPEHLVGPYRLEGLLGRGGMGEVHRAYDTRRGRTVALKLLPPHLADDTTYQARFRRESQVAAQLTEPHIIPIHDFGEIDGRLFIDMRLVEGTDLARLIEERGPLPPAQAVEIVVQAASALAAAHSANLIHRDVKPSNILITGSDGHDFVYLVDFGLAQTPGATKVTGTGTTIGTMAYMAPERFTGGPIDHRVDVYALGCLLFEALTGTRAFPGDSGPQLMYAHLNVPPPAPSHRRPGLPPGLDAVAVRAMAKAPEERYAAVTDLAIDARAAVRGWSSGRTGSVPGRAADVGPLPRAALPRAAPVAAAHALPTVTSTDSGPPTYTWAPGTYTRAAAIDQGAPGEAYPQAAAVPPPSGPTTTGRARRRWIAVAVAVLLAVVAVTIVRSVGATRDTASGTSPAPTAVQTAPVPGFAVSTLPTPGRIGDLALDAARHTLYLANLDGDVSMIDTNTRAVIGTLPSGGFQNIAVDDTGELLYGSNFNDRVVHVIDVGRRADVGTIPTPGGPLKIVSGPGLLYIQNVNEDYVSVFDTASRAEVARIPTGGSAADLITDRSGGLTLRLLLIAQQDTQTKTGSVLVADAQPKVVVSVPLGQPAAAIAFVRDNDNNTQTIYAATTDGAVSVVDLAARAVTARIPVGRGPLSLAVDPGSSTLYVANGDDDTVSVIDMISRTVLSTVAVGKSPSKLTVDPDTHIVYCATTEYSTLSIIQGRA